jgi:hypothetical protein
MTPQLCILEGEEETPAVAWPATPPLVWRDQDGTVCAFGQSTGGSHWVQFPGVGTYRFADDSPVTEVSAVPGIARALIEDTFQRSVLPLLLHTRGQEVLHASAVATSAGVLAFCAASETGKSTVAYGLVRRGYAPFGDDAVVLEQTETAWRVVPYPFRFRLRPAPAEFFAVQEPLSTPSGIELRAPRSLAALFLLTRLPRPAPTHPRGHDGAPSGAPAAPVQITRLSPAQAFQRLLPQAYCFSLADPARRRSMVEHYLSLAAGVPAFELCLAGTLDTLPTVLDAVEQTVDRL